VKLSKKIFYTAPKNRKSLHAAASLIQIRLQRTTNTRIIVQETQRSWQYRRKPEWTPPPPNGRNNFSGIFWRPF